MAKIRLVGGININVKNDKAQRIYSRWADKSVDRKSVAELAPGRFEQLGQIRGIDFEENQPVEGSIDEERRKYRQGELEKWDAYVKKCKSENPEEKARRIVATFAKLLWKVRLNYGGIEPGSEVEDNLLIRLIPYFAENPKEWHVTSEVYSDLIPYGQRKPITSNVTGVKTIGQLMLNPEAPKTEKKKTVCDVCNYKFEYEGETRPILCNRCAKDAANNQLSI